MKRSYITEVKSSSKNVFLQGWIQRVKLFGNLAFIILRDSTGIIQCVALKKNLPYFHDLKDITPESVAEIEGTVQKNKEAKQGYEVIIKKINILSKALTPLPIDVEKSKTLIDKRLDYRFLDLRRPEIQAIFKIQSEISNSFKEFFYKKGFIEMQPPCIISSASEGGTELFPVQYFEKKAFLAQSPQLYKQMLTSSLEKVFMLTPVWRAEKHNTIRHINEIRQMDIEMAFANQFDVMKELEEAVQYIVKNVTKKCKKEIEILNLKLKVPKAVYLSYEQAIKKANGKIGEDFTPEQEKKLCDLYPNSIIFTHSWPVSIKPFYIMPKDENPNSKLGEGFDALYGGIEIASGGQRIHIPRLLMEMIKSKGLNPNNFESYINSFKYGSASHSGWSIGLERLTCVICNLENIREGTLFPRDRERLTP